MTAQAAAPGTPDLTLLPSLPDPTTRSALIPAVYFWPLLPTHPVCQLAEPNQPAVPPLEALPVGDGGLPLRGHCLQRHIAITPPSWASANRRHPKRSAPGFHVLSWLGHALASPRGDRGHVSLQTCPEPFSQKSNIFQMCFPGIKPVFSTVFRKHYGKE